MSEEIHAQRREPEQPEGVFDLHVAGRDLLEVAGRLSAGRASRTLTPGPGVALKQTLLAIREGQRLGEHRAPDVATIQVLDGTATITTADGRLTLAAGEWAVIPDTDHDLVADADVVVLLTVVAADGTPN